MKNIILLTFLAVFLASPVLADLPEPDDKEVQTHVRLMFGHAEVTKTAHVMVARHGLILTSITARYETADKATYAFAYRKTPSGGIEAHFEVVVQRAHPASNSEVLKVTPPRGMAD